MNAYHRDGACALSAIRCCRVRRRYRRQFGGSLASTAVGLSTLAAIAASLIIAPSAHAQLSVELTAMEAPPPTPTADGQPGPVEGPPFRAVISGAPGGQGEDQFLLRQEDVANPVEVTAEKVKTYTESDDKMAMVVLVQGDERWIGNETYRDEDDPERLEGAFVGIGPALDALAKAGPEGSVAALIIYTNGRANIRQEMSAATELSGASLGGQKDYEGNITIPLLVGLDEAITQFDKLAGYRKILVVLGDGTGQEEDITAGLKDRIAKLRDRQAETFTIYYDVNASQSPMGLNSMKLLGYSGHKHASSRENFESFAKQFAETIGARYYVDFPGCTSGATPACFTHDGQEHEFIVSVGDKESDIIALVTTKWDKPVVEESSLWWLWLLIAVVVIAVIVVVFIIVRGRQQIIQPPPLEPEFEEPAPPQAAAHKTKMIDIGNNSGMPIVGWLVPLDGPNQYQTFKLLQGVTTIGSGGECNVVIDDTFMSGVHAEIVCSPTGFVLNDGGSTNGTYVNEARVSTHELVDNDMLTMGKTPFKFKSIN